MSPLWIIGVCVLWMGSANGQSVTCQIDLAILVDQSGSIKDKAPGIQNWYDTTNFTQDIINQFVTNEVQSHVALVAFGNKERIYTNLISSKTDIMSAVDSLAKIVPNDNTNTSSGLYVTLNDVFTRQGNSVSGDRPGVPDVVIVITDGEPTYGLNGKTKDAGQLQQIKDEVLSLSTQLKNKNILLITIGVTDRIDAVLLRSMASSPANFIEVLDFTKLQQELQPLIQSTCTSISTTPVPSTTSTTTQAPRDCRQDADIYFIIDSSGSIGEIRFKAVREYVTNVMQRLPIGQGTRVGVMYYGNNQVLGFNLLAHNSISDAVAATLKIPYMREKTNTADTIKYIREQGFTSGQGGRNGVPSIAVVLTDGNSNINTQRTLEEVYRAKAQGIHMISVGIGTWINKFELQSIASDPYSANYIQIDRTADFTNNAQLVNRLKALLCNDVNECNSVTCQCGGTCIDKIGSFSCSCPGSCAGRLCERDCTQRMDAIFAVDSSGSLQVADFRTELDFVRDAVVGLNIRSGDRVGLMRFSTNPFVRFQLNTFSSTDAVLNGIILYFDRGQTITNLALQEARNNMFTSGNGDRSGFPNVLVILTDGKSRNFKATWDAARLARQAGINVIAVGIGSNIRISELMAMASGPGMTNVFNVSNFNSLSSVSTDVINAVCNNRGECESISCQNGGTPVDHIGYCTCQCPQASSSNPGFSGKFCERRCSGKLDIVLVIDTSGSIRRERLVDVIAFISDFVSNYPVGPQAARFGAIYFSTTATKAFDLNTYSLEEDIITHLTQIPYMGQRTNIADALRIARNDMFTASNGDRSDADNFVVIITDGKSNENQINTIPNAISVRENVAKIVVLGIGSDANSLELRGMASLPTAKMMMMAPSFTSIKQNGQIRSQMMNSLVIGACDSINHCDSNPCVRGNCINDYHQYICECPTTYGGKNCDRQCTTQMDLALVLDFSASLDVVYNTVIGFAREMVYGLPAPGNVRVAVVDFDDTARVHFHLNKYMSTKEFIINALSFGEKGTKTNTQDALNLVTSQVFTGNNGDRSGVKNVAVVVTDGGSNIQQSMTLQRAREARNQGIELFVAAYGGYQMDEINGIANDPDSNHVVQIGMNNNVQQAASQMINLLCQ